MHRPVYSSLARGALRPSLQSRRSFSSRPALALWNGTTAPCENQKVPMPPSPTMPAAPVMSESERIERMHKKFVEELLSRAAASPNGLDSHLSAKSIPSSTKLSARKNTSRRSQNSMSEPPMFRTDGPLTPYPIELDSGELLEPKHATLVRITDKQGEERKIVVAEVEEESGKQRRVLLAVDLQEYAIGSGAVGRKVSAEDMYATLGLDRRE